MAAYYLHHRYTSSKYNESQSLIFYSKYHVPPPPQIYTTRVLQFESCRESAKSSNGWLTSSVYCSVPARLHLHQKIHPFKRGNVPLIISCHLPGLRRFHTLCGLSGRIARYLHRSAINHETVVRRSWRRVGAFREAVSVYVRRIISLANLLRRIGDGDSWQRLNTHWWPVDERVNKIEWNRD